MTGLRVGPRLNWQVIVPIVSGALLAVAAGMAICAIVALATGDEGAIAFGATAAIIGPLALAGIVRGAAPDDEPLRPRDGYLAVTLAWMAAMAVGAVPFLAYGAFSDPLHALFESVSGFTTTGATVLSSVEAQPRAILLWRSLSQWIGGVGIVVLVVALAPAVGLASQRVFYAESTGLPQDRLTPRIVDTAQIIAGIYVALTGLCFAAYVAAGMGAWDAINHALTTLATGGFSTRDRSLGAFDSLPVELVAIAFMTVAGINFAFYWRALHGRSLRPQLAEVRVYLAIIAAVTAVLTVVLLIGDAALGVGRSLRDGAFAAASVASGTGFATSDFGRWPQFAGLLLLALMFVGGCAGSTSGGMKVFRVMMLAKTAGQELHRQLAPSAVQVLRAGGRVFADEVRRGLLGFFLLYMLVFFAGVLAMSAFGLNALTAASASATAINVVGPGVGDIGALDSYAAIPDGGLGVLCALMLIGRLEVFTVLVLLTPAFWRRTIA
jgi:trk system potassium uptake protein TrkH